MKSWVSDILRRDSGKKSGTKRNFFAKAAKLRRFFYLHFIDFSGKIFIQIKRINP